MHGDKYKVKMTKMRPGAWPIKFFMNAIGDFKIMSGDNGYNVFWVFGIKKTWGRFKIRRYENFWVLDYDNGIILDVIFPTESGFDGKFRVRFFGSEFWLGDFVLEAVNEI